MRGEYVAGSLYGHTVTALRFFPVSLNLFVNSQNVSMADAVCRIPFLLDVLNETAHDIAELYLSEKNVFPAF